MSLSTPEIARMPVQNYLDQVFSSAPKLEPESFQQLVRSEQVRLGVRQKAIDTLTRFAVFRLHGKEEIITFGPKSKKLLMLLASHSGEVLSGLNIADTVGFGSAVDAEIRISNLRKKLGSQRDYIHTVRGQGYFASGDFPLEGVDKQPSYDLPFNQPDLIIAGVQRLDGTEVSLTPAEIRLLTELAGYNIVDTESLALAINPFIMSDQIPHTRSVYTNICRLNRKLVGAGKPDFGLRPIRALRDYGYYLRRPLPFTFRTTDIPPVELQKIIRPSSQNQEPKQEPRILMGVDVRTLAPRQADMFRILVEQSALGRYAARTELTDPVKALSGSRVVDVTISQLRGKIKQQNPDLKIKAVKGEGYALEVTQTG